jgi:hypothetical protein
LDAETRRPPWETTLFAAALDAAKGESWPAEGWWFQEADPRRRQTQARSLQLAGRLVGVHPQLDDTVREQIATRLAVPTMTLIGGADSWEKSWKLQRSFSAGPAAGRWCGERPVGAASPLGGTANALGWKALARFQKLGTARCGALGRPRSSTHESDRSAGAIAVLSSHL